MCRSEPWESLSADGWSAGSVYRRAPQVAAVTSLIGPQRKRAADDGVFGDRSEVAAVEAVLDVPVHEKDFARTKRPTALPDRQLAAAPIARQRLPHRDRVNADIASDSAHGLSGKRGDALHQRHAARQVFAFLKKTRQWFGRVNGDEISDAEIPRRPHRVEADRRTRRCIPDQLRRDRDGRSAGDGQYDEGR